MSEFIELAESRKNSVNNSTEYQTIIELSVLIKSLVERVTELEVEISKLKLREVTK